MFKGGGDKERHERGKKLMDDIENRISESVRKEMLARVTGFSYQKHHYGGKKTHSCIFSPQ